MAATISTRCITWPPSSFPSALVCAGSTTSAISEAEALTGFPCICTPSLTIILASRVPFMILLVCASPLYGSRLCGSLCREVSESACTWRTEFGPAAPPRIIRDVAMTNQEKSRRQKLEEYVAQNPKDAFSRYGLALECLKEGDKAAAETQFRALIENHPDYVPGF